MIKDLHWKSARQETDDERLRLALTFDYLKQHYDAVVAALPSDSLLARLPKVAKGFDTAERQSEIESFFKDKDPKLTGGPPTIAQTAKSIHLNQGFKAAQVPSLVTFLKAW